MEITSEKLKARLAGLHKGLEDIQEELRVTSGAVQECEYWLGVFEQQDPVEQSDGTHK